LTGEVKFFDNSKGFGFIKTGGKDLFFHITEVSEAREPQTGDKVTFEVGKNNKGSIAVNVKFNDVLQ
jgi:CspA family cold shock protein